MIAVALGILSVPFENFGLIKWSNRGKLNIANEASTDICGTDLRNRAWKSCERDFKKFVTHTESSNEFFLNRVDNESWLLRNMWKESSCRVK